MLLLVLVLVLLFLVIFCVLQWRYGCYRQFVLQEDREAQILSNSLFFAIFVHHIAMAKTQQ